ncbi:hypothetical protein [Zophobihabitans entericus]|uniref:Uncharacterized protein n=1 Tax=Zophobihabitans entericus TaxID=1635327 RepID=A0A6G9ICS2_9GAMM|nr:hypothetical protein [Zophobihabitans entericus]QIQ21380.1 hypothetical protein IPMB12_06565 [Zophobihabitans entericus]
MIITLIIMLMIELLAVSASYNIIDKQPENNLVNYEFMAYFTTISWLTIAFGLLIYLMTDKKKLGINIMILGSAIFMTLLIGLVNLYCLLRLSKSLKQNQLSESDQQKVQNRATHNASESIVEIVSKRK